jgi:biotin transport system substrate-specific component
MNVSKSKYNVEEMCRTAIFTAVLAVLAQISIPMAGGVPVTLQTFGVVLSGIVLGGRGGAMACIVYLVLGLAGVPVFSGFRGGPGVLFGPTGGFVISFPVMAYLAGRVLERAGSSVSVGAAFWSKIFLTGLMPGMLFNYAVGAVWFSIVTGSGLMAAVTACIAPFVINDLIKLTAAGIAGIILRKRLKRSGL